MGWRVLVFVASRKDSEVFYSIDKDIALVGVRISNTRPHKYKEDE